jgi:hypothetical protein
MKMNRRSLAAVAVVTFAILASQVPSQAQQSEPLRLTSPASRLRSVEPLAPAPAQAQAQTQTAQGELLDVDAKANTITIKTTAAEMTFRFNDETKVTGAQKGVAGLATMTGSQVIVQYRKDGQANIATSIEVRGAPK